MEKNHKIYVVQLILIQDYQNLKQLIKFIVMEIYNNIIQKMDKLVMKIFMFIVMVNWHNKMININNNMDLFLV